MQRDGSIASSATNIGTNTRRRGHRVAIGLIVLAGIAFTGTAANAALVVSNIPGSAFDRLVAMSFPSRRAASSFTLGAGFTPSTLDTVRFRAGTSVAGGIGGDAFLCFDDNGKPGATAVSLGSATIPNSFNGVNFTPISTFTLQPSTKYWVVLAHQPGGDGLDIQWLQNSNANNLLVPGGNPAAAIPNAAMLSFNTGASWSADPGFTFQFAVNATPVPAPGLGAAAIAAGLLTVRRRRR